MYVSCHRHFFPVLLLNQRWSTPLRLEASHCSTFHIMCDVPSIAVFCSYYYYYYYDPRYRLYAHAIYNYIHLYVSAVLYLQPVLHVMLFRPWHMFCNCIHQHFPQCVCSVPYGCFCSSLISCLPGMLLRYCLSDIEMVPVALIITGITFAFTFHMLWISIMKSLYFKIFSASFLITFLSPGIATSFDMRVPFCYLALWCTICC